MTKNQLFCEVRVGTDRPPSCQVLCDLEEQQIAVLAHARDEALYINLLQEPEHGEDIRVQSLSKTTWIIPISSMQPLLKQEVLLKGEAPTPPRNVERMTRHIVCCCRSPKRCVFQAKGTVCTSMSMWDCC